LTKPATGFHNLPTNDIVQCLLAGWAHLALHLLRGLHQFWPCHHMGKPKPLSMCRPTVALFAYVYARSLASVFRQGGRGPEEAAKRRGQAFSRPRKGPIRLRRRASASTQRRRRFSSGRADRQDLGPPESSHDGLASADGSRLRFQPRFLGGLEISAMVLGRCCRPRWSQAQRLPVHSMQPQCQGAAPDRGGRYLLG